MINSVLIVMVIATIATLLYILQLSRFTKAYGYIFDGLSDQEHPLKCVYPLGSVSYTHLDVYKRQILDFFVDISKVS